MGFFSSLFASHTVPDDKLLGAFYSILFECSASKIQDSIKDSITAGQGLAKAGDVFNPDKIYSPAIREAIDNSELFKNDSQETKEGEARFALTNVTSLNDTMSKLIKNNTDIVKEYGNYAIKELISIITNIFPYSSGGIFLWTCQTEIVIDFFGEDAKVYGEKIFSKNTTFNIEDFLKK